MGVHRRGVTVLLAAGLVAAAGQWAVSGAPAGAAGDRRAGADVAPIFEGGAGRRLTVVMPDGRRLTHDGDRYRETDRRGAVVADRAARPADRLRLALAVERLTAPLPGAPLELR